ncbi:unnamed protein product [Menidia menidia]|uniref:(Atlantic silverside) hypothetical protein n=1 Tax=Menidia menidia TaxID=238744 RepID=A0A8S4AN57_9TELE|nr:unnamed protein product [Menidia menidia]
MEARWFVRSMLNPVSRETSERLQNPLREYHFIMIGFIRHHYVILAAVLSLLVVSLGGATELQRPLLADAPPTSPEGGATENGIPPETPDAPPTSNEMVVRVDISPEQRGGQVTRLTCREAGRTFSRVTSRSPARPSSCDWSESSRTSERKRRQNKAGTGSGSTVSSQTRSEKRPDPRGDQIQEESRSERSPDPREDQIREESRSKRSPGPREDQIRKKTRSQSRPDPRGVQIPEDQAMVSWHLSSTFFWSSGLILSCRLWSCTLLFRLKARDSREFLAAILSLCSSSWALYLSASCSILSISSLLSRPLSLVMVILFSLPVLLSTADTFRMPLASMSKVTWICGTPRGAGGIPASSNLPSRLLSLVMALSPS